MKIPFNDLTRIHAPLMRDFESSFRSHVQSSDFIGGNSVSDFESLFADYIGVKYCVALNSGTSSLLLGSLAAKHIHHARKIFVQSNSFQASAEAVDLAGLELDFFDVDMKTRNPTKQTLRSLDESGVHYMPVHMNGNPVEMPESFDPLRVIEDASQAVGSRYSKGMTNRQVGGLGLFAAFSFYPGKNLGALGDAGCVTTNNLDIYKFVMAARDHGKIDGLHRQLGGTFRMDSVQAAILKIKLTHIDEWNASRIRIAELYDKRLEDLSDRISLIAKPKNCLGNGHIYSICLDQRYDRDVVRERLTAEGVATSIHYAECIPATNVFGSKYSAEKFDNAKQLSQSMISLPIFPGMTEAEICHVTDAVRKAL